MNRFISEKSEKLTKAVGRALPTVSYSELRALMRKKDVKVNGRRVADDVTLAVGDEVVLYSKEGRKETLPEIVYRDENILAVVKPKGIASVGENSLEERLKTALNAETVHVAHRLDTNTDGILLVALSEPTFDALKAAFKAGEIEKRYVTLVMGELVGKGVLRGFILKDAEASRVTVYDKPTEGARSAVTEYRAIRGFEGATKLEVRIKTGRTHQIRAQLAAAGHPVAGDGKYGDYEFNRKCSAKSQVLRAYYLKINIKTGLLAYLNGTVFKIDATFPLEEKLIEKA